MGENKIDIEKALGNQMIIAYAGSIQDHLNDISSRPSNRTSNLYNATKSYLEVEGVGESYLIDFLKGAFERSIRFYNSGEYIRNMQNRTGFTLETIKELGSEHKMLLEELIKAPDEKYIGAIRSVRESLAALTNIYERRDQDRGLMDEIIRIISQTTSQ